MPRSQFNAKKPEAAHHLAIDGAKPVRSTLLPYGHQSISEEDIQTVVATLRSPFLTRGPAVDHFERAVADLVQMPYAVAFANGTAALHAVMALLNLGKEDRVVTSPITFAATSNAVLYAGGRVEFQDVESKTLNLHISELKNLDKVKAVAAVDFAGNPCDYAELRKLQKKFGFQLISDAAHSLGASLNGEVGGSFGDLNILSFHPVKSITTGEGGMVLTRNANEAEFLRRFRSHGIVRFQDRPGYYEQVELGYNYNITDLQCSLGISQLSQLSRFISKRRKIADRYNEFFSKFEELETPHLTPGAESSWHLYPLRLNLKYLSVNRDEFLKALIAENIGANVHYIPVYWHPYYTKIGFSRELCPQAEAEYLREISLPIFPSMTDKDIADVCQAVEKIVAAYSAK